MEYPARTAAWTYEYFSGWTSASQYLQDSNVHQLSPSSSKLSPGIIEKTLLPFIKDETVRRDLEDSFLPASTFILVCWHAQLRTNVECLVDFDCAQDLGCILHMRPGIDLPDEVDGVDIVVDDRKGQI